MSLRPRTCSLCSRGLSAELLGLSSQQQQRPLPQPHHRRGSLAPWRPRFPCRLNVRQHAASSSGPTPPPASEERGKRQRGGSRKRLDEICRETFPQHSRSLLQSWIMQGKVTVDGKRVTKTGYLVPHSSKVLISASEPKYVCRAGLKMEAALREFDVHVASKVVLDAGLSTGGFTDCLLQNGAARVYGVDVGYGQVAEKIRVDDRVVVMERTNVRYLTAKDLPERVQIASLDLSFISILKVRRRPPPHWSLKQITAIRANGSARGSLAPLAPPLRRRLGLMRTHRPCLLLPLSWWGPRPFAR